MTGSKSVPEKDHGQCPFTHKKNNRVVFHAVIFIYIHHFKSLSAFMSLNSILRGRENNTRFRVRQT